MSSETKYINNGAMVNDMMAYSTDYFLSYLDFGHIVNVNDQSTNNKSKREWQPTADQDFLRVDGEAAVVNAEDSDLTSTAGIAHLNVAAGKLWTANQIKIQGMLEKILDERAKKDKWVCKSKDCKNGQKPGKKQASTA